LEASRNRSNCLLWNAGNINRRRFCRWAFVQVRRRRMAANRPS
uniref:Tetracycline resistance protein class M n=1 Tax=Heligmosomoides polygyrus TaxID=6339 RepID=A0A183FY72_HELPZ